MIIRLILPETPDYTTPRGTTQLKIAKVSPHDLRRTVGTEMARLGVMSHVRALVLNRSPRSRGVTDAVYNR